MTELLRSLTWGFGLTLGHAAAKLVIFLFGVACVFFVVWLAVKWIQR